MALPSNPQTRHETYLSNIAGQEQALPPDGPQTREESYLDFIARNGSGEVVNINLNTITVNKGTLDTDKSFIQRTGHVLTLAFRLTGVTAASGDTLITLPAWMGPKKSVMIPCLIGGTVGMKVFRVDPGENGAVIVTIDSISDLSLYVCESTWIVESTESTESDS